MFHVDLDTEPTLINFTGTVAATADLTIGAQVEAQLASNPSNAVSQSTEYSSTGAVTFTERHLEVFFDKQKIRQAVARPASGLYQRSLIETGFMALRGRPDRRAPRRDTCLPGKVRNAAGRPRRPTEGRDKFITGCVAIRLW